MVNLLLDRTPSLRVLQMGERKGRAENAPLLPAEVSEAPSRTVGFVCLAQSSSLVAASLTVSRMAVGRSGRGP